MLPASARLDRTSAMFCYVPPDLDRRMIIVGSRVVGGHATRNDPADTFSQARPSGRGRRRLLKP
jgi:hypothetical protein